MSCAVAHGTYAIGLSEGNVMSRSVRFVGSVGQLEQQCNVEDRECLALFRKLKF
jgi:hypothetical protein